MEYSKFLKSRHDLCKKLVERLASEYEYVSLLGTDVNGKEIALTSRETTVSDSRECEAGFVLKIYNGKHYSEYSFSDIREEEMDDLIRKIKEKITLSPVLSDNHVSSFALKDEPLVKEYERKMEGKKFSEQEIIEKLSSFRDRIMAYSPSIVQAMCRYSSRETFKMFISRNRDLMQHYTWINVMAVPVSRNEQSMQTAYLVSGYNSEEKCFEEISSKIDGQCQLAIDLLSATMIEPGVYDIITDPSITGLIAHEAFGHGVEMDMFVKNRAMSRRFINKYVASPLVNMHDGASSTLSCASYFFDDDGVEAHDTLIIKDGVLLRGISDALSAMQLGSEPTGNGRRESYSHKAYTRMTNTWFAPGKDKLEDMIKSVKHGYYLCQTDNGMEDPKNWNIQCTAQYGREIRDGKFTGKIVAPVVMSGYVPDLLKSISMVSDDFVIEGAGYCGKGHKEWVYVSDGGPCLKARCKLG